MKSSYTKDACSICSKEVSTILDLGSTPLADQFVNSPEDHEETFPLNVQYCKECGLAQLSEVVDDDILFKNDYAFFTGSSPSAVFHFEKYALSMIRQFPELVKNGLNVEIASNDGTFLSVLKKLGAKVVVGIDPADSVQDKAKENGIQAVHAFFNTASAEHLVSTYGKADFVTANNVVAHVDDLDDFANGINTLLSEEGVFVAEFQYFPELVMKNLFDNVYHEHRYYLSIAPIQKLFKQYGLEVFKVEDIDTQGGSVRVYIARNREVEDSVITKLLLEASMIEYVGSMQNRADSVKRVLRPLVEKLVAQGKKIYAYGASAKGNTMLNFCNITPDLVPFIVDKTPYKFGKYSPGMNLKVLDDQTTGSPDYYLLLVHNYYQSILQREHTFIEGGGKFIIPVPNIQII